MSDIIPFKLKRSYDHALREQSPRFQHSKGYPAVRDPAAENPQGLLQGAGPADIRRLRLHYSNNPIPQNGSVMPSIAGMMPGGNSPTNVL